MPCESLERSTIILYIKLQYRKESDLKIISDESS